MAEWIIQHWYRLVWGDPHPPVPKEIQDAARRVIEEANAVHTIVKHQKTMNEMLDDTLDVVNREKRR